MKATIKIIITAEIEVEDQAALRAAMSTLGGRTHMVLADGLEEATIEHWDFNTDYTVNYGAGVSLVKKEG